jgi:colicin import membrane protein
METFGDQARALLLAVAIHVALILLVWFGIDWLLPAQDVAAAGEPVQATLKVSAKDLQRAQAAIAKAEKAAKEQDAPKPQPIHEKAPQDSPTPPQPTPQAPLDKPDTVDQQAISRLAQQPPPEPATQEQTQRQRQEQVDLTEDIERQQEVERRQRLLAFQDIQKLRAAAERRTRLEEQKLQQLADLQPDEPAPARAAPQPAVQQPGNRGVDEGLLARYKAAMLQTADQNWNHVGAPEHTTCKIRFSQIPGGVVTNVEFIACPYDAEGREFVERALRKTDMPYQGFDSVFMPKVELRLCYPREECE